jgi:hypothetical protein
MMVEILFHTVKMFAEFCLIRYVIMVEKWSKSEWKRLFSESAQKMCEGIIIKMCFCLANPFFCCFFLSKVGMQKFNYSLIQFMCLTPSHFCLKLKVILLTFSK